ncbi:type I restriction enzyme, S subunit, partial [Staphylococcus saprophyticus]
MKIKPKLRFPEFDGEWEEKQLSAILEIGTGKSKVQSNESGKYNILGSTGIIGKSHTYDYEGDFILTARVGHYAGKLYKHAGKVNISDNTIYLFNFINKNFIYESLNAFKLGKLVFGSGQPLIKASDLKKLKIRVPVSKEQKKIGGFFSKLDRQIELEEQKLEKLEEQKKGYMQKLFSQEIRFKDNKGNNYPDWKIVEIGDILEERTERSGEGDMLSVTINNGIIKFDEIDRKDNSSKDKSNYRKVYKDDISYNSMRMWQGASGKSEYEG